LDFSTTVPGLRFCSLSSSSVHGNAYLIESTGGSRILVDCGVRLHRLQDYLQEIDVEPESLGAILLTHEHTDHVQGLLTRRPFAVRHHVPVLAPAGLWSTWPYPWEEHLGGLAKTVPVARTFRVGDLHIIAFPKPHDAAAPVGYLIEYQGLRLGVLTDLGHVPPAITKLLYGVDGLIFETNHDRELELRSGRHFALIERVLGDYGHLSNEQAAVALESIVTGRTQSILLGHLSLDCNRPELAEGAVTAALHNTGWHGQLQVAPAGSPGRWMYVATPAVQKTQPRPGRAKISGDS